MRRSRLLNLAAFALVIGAPAGAFAQSTNGTPDSLLRRFHTGVNVTRWFCYHEPTNDAKHFKTYLTDADFAAFKRLHVSFVRLCISPEVIMQAGKANPANLAFIDAALKRFERAKIAVLWDLHDNGQLKLDAEGKDNSNFVSFWEDVARHYRGRHESTVVFEVVNEPQFNSNAPVWYELQAKTVRAIRAIDPKRTIMVSPNGWSGINALAAMRPLGERNLIYTFHCYDPFFFTHQGAGWVGDQPKTFKQVPFPSSPEAVEAILDKNLPRNRSSLQWYGRQNFDRKYLHDQIRIAMSWAAKNHVPVILGEFGAYPPVSPPDSRARWFQAMRSVIAELKVPNSIWGYDDALGLGRKLKSDGKLWLDPVTLQNYFAATP